jgi:hypothetical protein
LYFCFIAWRLKFECLTTDLKQLHVHVLETSTPTHPNQSSQPTHILHVCSISIKQTKHKVVGIVICFKLLLVIWIW